MARAKALGLLVASAAFVVWACGGTSSNPVGAGDGGSSSGSSNGGASSGTGSSGAASSSGSSNGGASSGAASSGSSGGTASSSSGGAPVTGNPFVCGTGANASVCDPPNICCGGGGGTVGGGGGGGVGAATCEAQSACTTGLSAACGADSCPSGSLCCASITVGAKGDTGTTQCLTGSCGSDLQLCSTTVPCPTGERCEALGAGGAIDVCRAGITPIPDGGGFKFPDADTTD